MEKDKREKELTKEELRAIHEWKLRRKEITKKLDDDELKEELRHLGLRDHNKE